MGIEDKLRSGKRLGKGGSVRYMPGDRMERGTSMDYRGRDLISAKPEVESDIPKLAGEGEGSKLPPLSQLKAQRADHALRAPKPKPMTPEEMLAKADRMMAEIREQKAASMAAGPAVRDRQETRPAPRPEPEQTGGVPEWLRRYMEQQRTSSR